LLEEVDSGFKPYSRMELQTLFDFRSKDTEMSFEDFEMVESRKAFQGMFMGTDYFIRFVKDWVETGEHYGDVCYTNSGYAKITAKIVDDSDSLFTPCTYSLRDVVVVEGSNLPPIKEIVSFRGRFCKQVPSDQQEPTSVEVQGKVELCTDTRTKVRHYRIIIGNKPTDYMVIRKT